MIQRSSNWAYLKTQKTLGCFTTGVAWSGNSICGHWLHRPPSVHTTLEALSIPKLLKSVLDSCQWSSLLLSHSSHQIRNKTVSLPHMLGCKRLPLFLLHSQLLPYTSGVPILDPQILFNYNSQKPSKLSGQAGFLGVAVWYHLGM